MRTISFSRGLSATCECVDFGARTKKYRNPSISASMTTSSDSCAAPARDCLSLELPDGRWEIKALNNSSGVGSDARWAGPEVRFANGMWGRIIRFRYSEEQHQGQGRVSLQVHNAIRSITYVLVRPLYRAFLFSVSSCKFVSPYGHVFRFPRAINAGRTIAKGGRSPSNRPVRTNMLRRNALIASNSSE